MSFVDLMANDVWSEADIIRRTEAMIRSEFPAEVETILNRKIVASGMGQYELTQAEMIEVGRYKAVAEAAQIEGAAARADMALLAQVLAYEAALRALANPELPEDQRAEAQAVVDAAEPGVVDLYELRNPLIEEQTDAPLLG